MSNLATITPILNCVKHPNADTLFLVTVMGWQCVTNVEYAVGDLVVYIQIDTTVPRADWSSFLFKHDDRDRERIRSIRLRGKISQGLVLPQHAFGSTFKPTFKPFIKSMIGQDVSEELGVEKYVKPDPINQEAKGPFPTELVSITDEERLQNVPDVLDELRGQEIYITSKLDGMSATFVRHDGELHVCSRTQSLKDGNNAYWNMARKYDLINLPDGIVVQGEIVGPKIQGNTLGLDEVDLYVFNVGITHGRTYSGFEGFMGICESLGLQHVPILFEGMFQDDWDIPHLLEYADAQTYENGKTSEGIVIRPKGETFSTELQGRLSVKVISNKYALKHGE